MKLYYNDILLGEALTNHYMSVDDMIDILDIDMDDFAESQGWDNWDYECLGVTV